MVLIYFGEDTSFSAQKWFSLSVFNSECACKCVFVCPCSFIPAYNWNHDDVIKWKHFPRYWPFVRGIHRWPVNSPHKGQWRGALTFSLICAWVNGWVNTREAGDLRCHRAGYDVTVISLTRHRAHYDVIVMMISRDKSKYISCMSLLLKA